MARVMADARTGGSGVCNDHAQGIIEIPCEDEVIACGCGESSGAGLDQYWRDLTGNQCVLEVRRASRSEKIKLQTAIARYKATSTELEWGSDSEPTNTFSTKARKQRQTGNSSTEHFSADVLQDDKFPRQYGAQSYARYGAGFNGIVLALATRFFPTRLLLMLAFICLTSAHPVGNTWSGAHGLPAPDTTEQGLQWLWRLLRPLLPIPINIAGLIWSGLLLRNRLKAGAPYGEFSMLLFFVTISGPVSMALYYGTSTPDSHDLAVMTAICLFFAYPFATHLGCLLTHNIRTYTAYVLTLVLTCLLVTPTLGRRIKDEEARQLLNVLQPPLLILLSWLGFHIGSMCVLQNPFRDCALRSPVHGLRARVGSHSRPVIVAEGDHAGREHLLLDDRRPASSQDAVNLDTRPE